MRVACVVVGVALLAAAASSAAALEPLSDEEMASVRGESIYWHWDCHWKGCAELNCPWHNCDEAWWNPDICARLRVNWEEQYFDYCTLAEVGMVCEPRPQGAPNVMCGFYETSDRIEGKLCDDTQCNEHSNPTCPADNCYGGYPA